MLCVRERAEQVQWRELGRNFELRSRDDASAIPQDIPEQWPNEFQILRVAIFGQDAGRVFMPVHPVPVRHREKRAVAGEFNIGESS